MSDGFSNHNPLLRACELTSRESAVELFADSSGSFLPKAHLLCSVEAIQDAFVKKHKIFTEMIHPFKDVRPFLSPVGFQALRMAGPERPQDIEVKALDDWLKDYQYNFLLNLSQQTETFDLYYELSFLSLNFSLKFLFNFEGEELARDFLNCSLEFEHFLAEMRRGSLRESSDDEIAKIKKEIFLKQSGIVSSILTSIGVKEIDDHTVRAFTRTVLNSYVGTATSFFWMTDLLNMNEEVDTRLLCDDESYRQAFINESLRLYPSAWMMTRRAEEDTIIEGTQIKEGEMVHVCLYSLHRDSRYWTKPEEFNLERFLDSKASKLPAFLPFGVGPRRCVGSKYAYYILELFLKEYVAKFKVNFSEAETFKA